MSPVFLLRQLLGKVALLRLSYFSAWVDVGILKSSAFFAFLKKPELS